MRGAPEVNGSFSSWVSFLAGCVVGCERCRIRCSESTIQLNTRGCIAVSLLRLSKGEGAVVG